MIFHVTTAREWTDAEHLGDYRLSTRGKTLDEVGFIHCSHAHQIDRIKALIYGDCDEDLVVLAIDPAKLTDPVVDENLDGGHEQFPHLYGPLPVHAVVRVDPV